MKQILSTITVLVLLLSSFSITNAADSPEVHTMSVKLKNYIGNPNQITVTVKGQYVLKENNFSLAEGKTYSIKANNGALLLYENDRFISNFTSFTLIPKEYGTANYLAINKRPYLGTMEFVIENGSIVRPINTLPLEDYLKGVVPYEMMASWNKEALKAQAVAARTYADRDKYRLIDDTISFQVYGGYDWYPNSTMAVEETKNQVLTYQGKLIDALYSASNGGMTESNANVWNGTPLAYFPIKQDPYDIKVSWNINLKKSQVNTGSLDLSNPQIWWTSTKEADSTLIANIKNWMLQNGYANYDIKIITVPAFSFSADRTSGGRVKYGSISLNFFLKDKTTGSFVMENNKIKTHTLSFTNVNATRLRAMFGVNEMKSYLVTQYTDNGTAYSVAGLGNGHGVGMSQWGAKVMADKGLNYRDILNFYYPGTTLTNPTAPLTIENLSTSYIAPDNQIKVNYSVNGAVTADIYVKDSTGNIVAYPIKAQTQSAGDQQITLDTSAIPNGVYTIEVSITNTMNQKASALKNIEIYKAPSKLKAITYKETVVSGKVAANAEVTIKSGSRTLKPGKANSVGHFVITLPKQRNNTSLTVTATDGSSYLIKVTR